MLFVDPLFQACLVEVVRASADIFGGDSHAGDGYERALDKGGERDGAEWTGLPIIYDEGRLHPYTWCIPFKSLR
jgi:dethiobiotin synthetase/adenosylmethionine--8-amino-7-oxononanoate aminotransferase